MKYIYALIDPRDSQIRYVGRTDNPDRRFRQHVGTSENTPKARWIQELKVVGKIPDLVILDSCEDDQISYRETWWIALGRRQGWKLTNSTSPSETRVQDDFKSIFSLQLQELYHHHLTECGNPISKVKNRERTKWFSGVTVFGTLSGCAYLVLHGLQTQNWQPHWAFAIFWFLLGITQIVTQHLRSNYGDADDANPNTLAAWMRSAAIHVSAAWMFTLGIISLIAIGRLLG